MLFLIIFGLGALMIHALMRSPTGREMLAVRSSDGGGAGVRHPAGAAADPDLRPVGRHRRPRRRAPGDERRHHLEPERAAGDRPGVDRGRRHLRHPAPRRRAPRRIWRSAAARSWSSTGSATTSSPAGCTTSSRRRTSPPCCSVSAPSTSRRTPTASSPSSAPRRPRSAARRHGARHVVAAEAELHGDEQAAADALEGRVDEAERAVRERRGGGVAGAAARHRADRRPRSRPRPRPTPTATLWLDDIVAGYGAVEVLHGASRAASSAGEVVALLGANGAGQVDPVRGGRRSGRTDLGAGACSTAPTSPRRRRCTGRGPGMLLVPEARGIFPGLTVEENLKVLLRDPAERKAATDRFPVLGEAPRPARRPAVRVASSRC